MDTNSKLISIVVPVYNVEKYLDTCVASICGQSYTNLEIILVDDGSTDHSVEKCDKWQEEDSRICVVHKKNEGLSSARNIGIERSHGEYIAFVDSDDSIHEKFIEILYQLCEENDCQVAQCDFLYVKEDYPKLPLLNYNNNIIMIDSMEAVRNCCMGSESVKYNVAWNKLYKKELFADVRYPLGKFHEDEFVSYKILWKVSRMAVINEYLYYYLQRDGSIMSDKTNFKHLDRLEAWRERAHILKKKDRIEEYSATMLSLYRDIWYFFDMIKYQTGEKERSIKKFLCEEAEKLESDILNLPGRAYFDNLEVVYPHMSAAKKKNMKKLYGAQLIQQQKEQVIFPFQLIPREAKIAIYGAGGIGHMYYRQLQATNYCNVVYWVDNRWSNFEPSYNIRPIYDLIDGEFDFIVIALKAENVACVVKERLISWGFAKSKIIWNIIEIQ